MKNLNLILEGVSPREVFLSENISDTYRFPVDVRGFKSDKLTSDQIEKIKTYSKQIIKWMKEFVKGSDLDFCSLILKQPTSKVYMDITPNEVVVSDDLYHYTPIDMADTDILGLLVFNWDVIKEKIKRSAEWLRRFAKDDEENTDSVGNKLTNFAV